MAKASSIFICQQCGYRSPQFLGRCPECGNWGTLVESVSEPEISGGKKRSSRQAEILSLKDIEKRDFNRVSTKIAEFDRVLGGGIVQGSVVLVAGDPGIGKSTLLSQLALNVEGGVAIGVASGQKGNNTQNNHEKHAASNVLYVAGEESPQQIKLRIDRIKNSNGSLSIVNETDVDVIGNAIEKVKPSLVIVDSVQTLETQDLTAAPGSISQVRESAHRLQRVAKALHVPIFIVGHVTKEGTVAGPRTLEHLVDVVLTLEGEQTNNFRVLRAIKNRFGPTDEVGIFEMEESGIKEVINPSELFLNEKISAPGSVVTAILTGLRPMLLEIQALVTKTYAPIPRRVGTGVDNNRLQLLVAVLQKRLKLNLYDQDVFVNVTGGIKIVEPAADLAICMAIISSFQDITLPEKGVFIGEVGLLGELRTVRQLEKRQNEAGKLGYSESFSPAKFKTLSEIVSKLSKS